MKKIYLLIIATIITIGSKAQTSVPAGNVSGVWTLANSPYNVQGNIKIPNGQTLTIEPGVVVNFGGMYKIDVKGRLLAIGTVTDSIIFTATNIIDGWRGIRFDQTPITNDTSKIIYCKIQYGKVFSANSPEYLGGAFYFSEVSKAIISHSYITRCSARAGGAIYAANGSDIMISYNTLTYDTSFYDYGGAISLYESSPKIIYNNISNNKTYFGGAAIFCRHSSSPDISNNIISHNESNLNGAGIFAVSTSLPTIKNNTISYNISNSDGGGIYIDNNSSSITGNTISNNTASSGGGISIDYGENFSITKNIISNNTSYNNGGGINFNHNLNNLILSNNLISNNTATSGGGIYFNGGAQTNFINCTIVNNKSTDGGGLYFAESSTPIFRNCILWGNTVDISGSQVYILDDTGVPNFHYCDIQDGIGNFELNGYLFSGSYLNNIDSLPLFISPSAGSGISFDGLSANWELQTGSYCINSGDPAITTPLTDIAGNQRTSDCRIDIGAYEFQTSGSLTVAINQTSSIVCNGNTTGALQATAAGVGAPYTYSWSPGGSTSFSISNLGSGSYTVTATNSTGCTTTATATITQPALSIQTSKTDVQCQGQCNGSATVAVSGQNAPFTYLWNTLSDSSSLSNLCVGTYSVTITDSAGCIFNDSVVIENLPGSISLTPFITQASCGANDANISLAVFPSASDYTWSTGSHSQSLYDIGSGTYWVIVSDTNSNCVITDTFTITNSRPIDPVSICMVTVDSSSTKNVIIWEKPASNLIDSFKVYREVSSVYTYLGSVTYEDLSEFTDNTIGVNPNITSYKYRLTTIDTCGNESELSIPHHTVHLQISAAIPQGVNLSWNDYEGFSFSQYRILRDDLGNGNWQVLDSVSYGITTYTSTEALPNARFIVEAKNPTPCVATRSNSYTSSKSNTASQTTGINEVQEEHLTVSIFPNPASDNIAIKIDSQFSVNRKYELKLLNLLGECIKIEELKGNKNNVINLSGIPAGIYFATVISNGKTYSTKIVKQ